MAVARTNFHDWRIADQEFALAALVADIDDFSYTGYDPAIIAAVLLAYAGNDPHVLKNDMARIIAFYLTRGARINRPRILNTMDDRGKEKLRLLRDKYHIKDGIHEVQGANGLGQKTVTIPRIIGTFAHLVPFIIRRIDTGGQGGPAANIRIVGELTNFPRELSFPTAIAFIPRTAEFAPLRDMWFQWADRFTTVIQSNPARNDVARPYKKLSDAIAAQRAFATITHNAAYYTAERRNQVMRDLGYTPAVFSTWVINAAEPIHDLTEAIGATRNEQAQRADMNQ
jgi:hypothetical protein